MFVLFKQYIKFKPGFFLAVLLLILGLIVLVGCINIPLPKYNSPPTTDVLRGEQAFVSRGCFQSCHSTGTVATKGKRHTLPNQPGSLPPDLTMTPRRSNDWLLAYMIFPRALLRYSSMSSYAYIPDEEMKLLIAYLQSINTNPIATNIPITDPEVIPQVPSNFETYKAGRSVYRAYCEGCHGRDGNGKGPVGHLLFPEPRDFTDVAWLSKQSDTYLFSVVSFGKLRTAMPQYNDILTLEQRAQVLNYIMYFADPVLKQRMELPSKYHNSEK